MMIAVAMGAQRTDTMVGPSAVQATRLLAALSALRMAERTAQATAERRGVLWVQL